jgi:hypothetical protein
MGRVQAEVREFFLLERVTRDTEARSVEQRRSIRAWHDGGRLRQRAAQVLRGPELGPASLALYREAAFLFAVAFLISRDASLDPGALTAKTALVELDAKLAKEGISPAPSFEATRTVLQSSDPLELDRLALEGVNEMVEQLEQATSWLAELVDPRMPRELKTTSVLRIAGAGLLVLAGLIFLGIKLFGTKNLAASRPATSSSVALSTTPDGAVDGSKNGRSGFHSAEEDSPWWSVDLGEPFVLTRIRVFGRDDCCFDQSVPLALEVSDDGSTYRKVTERTQPFSQADPWVVTPQEVVARYLRLRTLRKSYLVLGEVEVNGHKP